MKIAILVPNFSEYSGDARVVARQAEKFSAEGHSVTIFAFSGNIDPKSIDLILLGMPKNLLFQRIYRLLFPLDVFKVAKWLPEFQHFDKVIAHLYPMTYYGYRAKKRYNIEFIFWYHGLEDPEVFSCFHERVYMKAFQIFTRYTLKNVDRAVSVSKFAQKMLLKTMGIPSEVEYNEVSMDIFNLKVDGTPIRKYYKLDNFPVILSVGRLVPQKKVDLLIKAFHLIKKEIPDTKLVIIGKPTFEDYYLKLQKLSDDSIIFIDQIPNNELPPFYAMCDIYATCSYWENHNLPILEAQLCGRPVIAFDIEAFREEIDGDGILVKKGDIFAFSVACVRKIRENRPLTS